MAVSGKHTQINNPEEKMMYTERLEKFKYCNIKRNLNDKCSLNTEVDESTEIESKERLSCLQLTAGS
jgi:hypothetical protein